MTLITQENEHDRLATRLSIILSRLFQGEKLHIGAEQRRISARFALLSSPHGTGYEDTGETAAS